MFLLYHHDLKTQLHVFALVIKFAKLTSSVFTVCLKEYLHLSGT